MPTRPHAALSLVLIAVMAASVTGCQPEPGETAAPTVGATATTAPTEAAPSPTATAAPFEVPASCDALYSPGMLATLQQQPLNDPGVTLASTQVVAGLEVLSSGVPSIRCGWGAAGAAGLVTTVAAVSADQADSVLQGLREAGMACSDTDGGTLCGFEEQVLTVDDTVVTRGETHFLGGGAWIATSSVDFDPAGYTEDIVAAVGG